MKIKTKRFGEVEFEQDKIVEFPRGLIGFPDYTQFIVMDLYDTNHDMKWLQSVQEPSLGFVVISPFSIFPDYAPHVSFNDMAELRASQPDELVVMAVVTVPKNIKSASANLQAPILINPSKRIAKQVILTSPEYTTKHNIFSSLERLLQRTG